MNGRDGPWLSAAGAGLCLQASQPTLQHGHSKGHPWPFPGVAGRAGWDYRLMKPVQTAALLEPSWSMWVWQAELHPGTRLGRWWVLRPRSGGCQALQGAQVYSEKPIQSHTPVADQSQSHFQLQSAGPTMRPAVPSLERYRIPMALAARDQDKLGGKGFSALGAPVRWGGSWGVRRYSLSPFRCTGKVLGPLFRAATDPADALQDITG